MLTRTCKLRKRIAAVMILFIILSAAIFIFPQNADAATPTVKMGGVALTADNAWHAYNSKKPTISGWTAGKYKLSKDGKTLELNGVKYSGSKRGIYSSAALTVKTTGTNTFTCNGARGIGLGTDDDNLKNLTLTGTSGSVLNLKCTNARSICVNTCTFSTITVNATGTVYCEANYNGSSGKMAVTGNYDVYGNSTISGGTLTASGETYIETNYKQTAGTVSSGKNMCVWGNTTISGGTLTVSGDFSNCAYSMSAGTVTCKGGFDSTSFSGTGGSLNVTKNIFVDGSMIINGSNVTANNGGIDVSGNLNVAKGTLTGKSTSNATNGVFVNGNATISGTGKVVATAGDYIAFNIEGTLTQSGGTIEATNSPTDSWDALRAPYLKMTGGTTTCKSNANGWAAWIQKNANIGGGTINGNRSFLIEDLTISAGSLNTEEYLHVYQSLTGSGGSVTATNYIDVDSNLNLTGATITASTNGIRVWGNLIASKGTLTGKSPSSRGVYVANNLTVSGTAVVNATGNNAQGMYVGEGLNVSGGTITSKSDSTNGLWADSITVTGGSVSGSGNSSGVITNHLTVKGGYLYGESKLYEGVCAYDSFEMTGGKLTGKTASNNYSAIYAGTNDGGKISIADDIWISAPSGGYTSQDWTDSYLYIYDSNYELAKEATLQKVTNISVNTKPTTQLYRSDCFDPNGLVLNLEFADGAKSTLRYIYNTRNMFSFDVPANQALSVGTKTIGITCLTKSTSMDITIKDIAAPSIYGYTTMDTVRLYWSYVDGAHTYYIYAKAQGESSYTCLGETSYRYFELTGLSTGETRDYYVIAKRYSTSGMLVSSSRSNILKLTTELHAPVLSISGKTYDSLTIKWDAVDGAKEYRLYRKGEDSNNTLVAGTGDCEYVDTGLDTGREYSYYAIAVTENELVESVASNIVSATPEFKGKAELSVKNNNKGYDLTWNAVDGATGYEVWRGDGAKGERRLIATITNNGYTDSTADSYKIYNYVVKSVRSIESGKFYGTDSAVAVGDAKPAEKDETENITKLKNDSDSKDALFSQLQARSPKVGKNNVQLAWNSVKGARKYIVYGNKCGTKNKYKKLFETKSTKYNIKKILGKKLQKGTYYKFVVVAVDAKGKKIATSKTIHVATTGGKYGNDKKVVVKAKVDAKGKAIKSYKPISSTVLKKGKSLKLKTEAVAASKKLKVSRHRAISYESSNSKVASVSKGVIKAKSPGTCYIYAYAQNGVYKKIKITVKP